MTTSPIEAIRSGAALLPVLKVDLQFSDGWLGGPPNVTASMLKTIIAALEAATLSQPAVVDGWKMVPVEPTVKMLDAARRVPLTGDVVDHYKAMLSASPAPASKRPTDEDVERVARIISPDWFAEDDQSSLLNNYPDQQFRYQNLAREKARAAISAMTTSKDD